MAEKLEEGTGWTAFGGEVGSLMRCIEEAEYQRLLRIIEKQTDLILQLNERIHPPRETANE